MNQSKPIFLTSQGFQNIKYEFPNDFTFIINDEKFACPSFFADFISPKISKIHSSDLTFNSFSITTPFIGTFNDFFLLFKGEPMMINDNNYQFMKHIASELQNTEILEYFKNNIQELSNSNVFQIIESKKLEGVSYEDEIVWIASHFYEIDANQLFKLPFEDLSIILSNQNLRTHNEDEVFDFVLSKVNHNPSYFELFEFVHFPYLSIDRIEIFLSMDNIVKNMNLNSGVFRALSQRLLMNRKDDQYSRYFQKAMKIEYDEKRPFNGVFHYLMDKHKKDLFTNNIIHLNFSTCATNNPSSIVYQSQSPVFQTDNHPNSWIAFDFSNMKIRLTSYSLMSYYLGKPNFANPKSWVIEGSNDARMWIELDRQVENPDLNGKSKIKNFPIKEKFQAFKFIRMKQIGPNWAGMHQLTLSGIEFFGHLIEKEIED